MITIHIIATSMNYQMNDINLVGHYMATLIIISGT